MMTQKNRNTVMCVVVELDMKTGKTTTVLGRKRERRPHNG